MKTLRPMSVSMSVSVWTLALLLLLGTAVLASGCSVWEKRPRLRKQKISMNEPVDQIPPIRLDALNAHHMLVMQAPHSGWSFAIEKDERIPDGKRLFITVRRPNPTFLYPQMIVEKNLLTDIPIETSIELYARILDHDEKSAGKGYGLLTPVEHFED